MILDILTYPDKRLKQKSQDVTKFDKELHLFLDAMNETMIASNGIGLAAIQVNKPINALIINLPNEEGEQLPENLMEFINPVITATDGHTTYQEGCLSVPGFYEDVERFENVTVTYKDRHANEHTLHADDLLSIAIQHEMDHLLGRLFIEKLPYMKRKKFEKEYKRMIKEKSLALS